MGLPRRRIGLCRLRGRGREVCVGGGGVMDGIDVRRLLRHLARDACAPIAEEVRFVQILPSA